jgi:hypothetical protein
MANPLHRHGLAAMLALCCYVLAGCVLAEVHFTASPIPPWVTLDIKGLDDSHPTVVVATTETEPPATAPAAGMSQ